MPSSIASLVLFASFLSADADRPNVLLILTDDQGWGDLSLHDAPGGLQTPHLDSIARDGAQFDRFYVSPVCAPTRASLLTGRLHWRTGTHGVTRGREHMRADEVTLAEVFGEAGYATGCFGKWHNGSAYPLDPVGQGFDRFVGFCAGHWNNYFDTTLRFAERLPSGTVRQSDRPTDGYITDVLTDEAIAFIEAADGPFLCYVPYNAPHWPAQVPDEYYDRFAADPTLDAKQKAAYAMVANIDDNVGRLLRTLDEGALRENTIVVFLTDNGANSNRWDGDMRGAKGTVYEGGIRVPCFIRYPNGIKPGTVVEAVGQHVDLLPTLATLCGVDLPERLAATLDGVDLAASITEGLAVADPHPIITARLPGGASIDRAKAAVLDPSTRLKAVNNGSKWQLFDIAADPSETTDLAASQPERLNELTAIWSGYLGSVAQPLVPVSIPVGDSEQPVVRLQGHEAILHGVGNREGREAIGRGIAYHGPAGWANDWIDRWDSAEAYPFWTVDVVNAGEYDAVLKYRQPPAELGTSIEVVAERERTGTNLDHAVWTAPIDSPDRFPRSETYEQQWAEQPLGTFRLQAGPQRIELRKPQPSRLQVLHLELRPAR